MFVGSFAKLSGALQGVAFATLGILNSTAELSYIEAGGEKDASGGAKLMPKGKQWSHADWWHP